VTPIEQIAARLAEPGAFVDRGDIAALLAVAQAAEALRVKVHQQGFVAATDDEMDALRAALEAQA
jgi:hypothetical protein